MFFFSGGPPLPKLKMSEQKGRDWIEVDGVACDVILSPEAERKVLLGNSSWSVSSSKDALVATLSRTAATVSNPKKGISLHRQKSAVERIFRTCSENFNLKELCINFTSDCFERQVHVKDAART